MNDDKKENREKNIAENTDINTENHMAQETEHRFHIPWGPLTCQTYLYGTRLSADADGSIRLENRLIPPGQTVKVWDSRTNYQLQRCEPQLPLLEKGRKYRISVHAETEPAREMLLRVTFYDCTGKETGTVMLRCGTEADSSVGLNVPKGTGSYRIALLQNGWYQLHFRELEIVAEAGGTDLHGISEDVKRKVGNVQRLKLPRWFHSQQAPKTQKHEV